MARSLTPAKDFMEARGWSWGPWSAVLHVEIGVRPKVSAFEKRARRLAADAWHSEQVRRWYAENTPRARAAQARYRARHRADRETHIGA